LSGKLAGDDENYKAFYNKITDISPRAPIEREDCSQVGYTNKVATYNMTVAGVDASIWLQPQDEKS